MNAASEKLAALALEAIFQTGWHKEWKRWERLREESS